MKKLLSVLMAAAMLVGVLSLAGCGGNGGETTTDPAADADNSAATTETAGDLTTVTAGKLTMSTNAQFPPYEMVADDGSFEGIDIEVADAIAKKLGLELQVDDMDFDAALLAAQNGKSDMVMAGVTVNEERQAVMDFSDSYAKGVQVVIVPEDSDIQSIDNKPAQEYVAANPGLKILDGEFTNEDYAIGVAKGNTALLDAINGALKELIDDGTVQSIIDKYIPAEAAN